MSGAKFPKMLAIIGIIFYVSINWYVVEFNDARIFDMTNEIITNTKIRNLMSIAKIIIILIATLGITIELLRVRKKHKTVENDFVPEIVGIYLNLFLLSFTIISFWTLFY